MASAMTRRQRAFPVGRVILLALLVVPTIEIAIIIAVGKVIGAPYTIALLVAESMLGAWLVKREGARAWRALAGALQSGTMPAGPLADAALVLVGGTLLLTPGFLTDLVGFFFVLPITRPLARTVLQAAVARRLLGSVVVMDGRGSPPTWGGTRAGHQRPDGGAPAPSDDVIEGEVL